MSLRHSDADLSLPPGAAARSARLLFSDRLAEGLINENDLERSDVLGALAARPVPSMARRYAQRFGMKRDPEWFERRCIEPLLALREAVLGDGAPAPPRFLVRVDEYPLAGAYEDGDARLRAGLDHFHATLTEAGIPYVMAVCPAVARDYLDPSGTHSRRLSDHELRRLHQMRDDGVEFALHGFDHRTRHLHPRRRSELAGLEPQALSDLLDRGMDELTKAELDVRVFCPPFNRFDAAHYDVLAKRFDIVCGGPESVVEFGFQPTPQWRGEAAYLPAYEPFYGLASSIADAVKRSVDLQQGVWIPLVLHWSWEIDHRDGLERLVGALAGHTHTWSSFLRAAEPYREPDKPISLRDRLPRGRAADIRRQGSAAEPPQGLHGVRSTG